MSSRHSFGSMCVNEVSKEQSRPSVCFLAGRSVGPLRPSMSITNSDDVVAALATEPPLDPSPAAQTERTLTSLFTKRANDLAVFNILELSHCSDDHSLPVLVSEKHRKGFSKVVFSTIVENASAFFFLFLTSLILNF